jgi:hypothetical protein
MAHHQMRKGASHMKTVEHFKNEWFDKILNNFWTKVKKTETCWLWIGGVHKNGYGAFTVLRHHLTPHRFSWTLHKGEIPEGYWVLHKCDVRLCVNPEHLFIGDRDMNISDMVLKNRQAKGTTSGVCKFTEEQVREIRMSYVPWKTSMQSLADKYGVTVNSIFQIVHRKTWRHI